MDILDQSFGVRAEELLRRVFGGMHHVMSLVVVGPKCWTCLIVSDAATYDFDILTRLVLGAHEYAIRVQISNGGPRRLKVWLHERGKRTGDYCYERHPDIHEAIASWANR